MPLARVTLARMTGRTADDRRRFGAVQQAAHSRHADARVEETVGIGRRLLTRVQEDDVLGLAAEIAYRFLFAVFPFGLFVAALGGFVAAALRIENPAQQLVAGLGDNLPPAIADALRPELERLLGNASGGLLSIGALAALWAATGGTNALIKGMHRAYGVPEQRPFLLRYAVAIGLTLLAAVGVILSFVTIVGGALLTQELAERIGLGDQAFAVIQLLRWPAVFVVLTFAVAILYRYAPSVVVPWRWILAGAALFTLGWLVATAGLGWYASNVADYGATYGSLGAVIVLMLWFYVTGALLLLGAELSAALARERTPDEIRARGEERAAAAAIGGAANTAREKATQAADSTSREEER
jgi:membrane protein